MARVGGSVAMRTITCIERIPPPKGGQIICKKCGAEFPRWMKRANVDDPRRSGMWLLIAHQMDTHGDES